MIWGTLALAFAAAFTGDSFYVNWVEQPARLKLDEEALLSEWGPSDSRGVSLLAAVALVSRSPASSPISKRRTCAGRSARSSSSRAGFTPSS